MPTPQELFKLPSSYNRLSDFFPNSGEDQGYINQVNETAAPPSVQGVNPALMEQAAQMGMDPFNVMDMAKKIQADIQSQRLIRSIGDIDFNEKDSNDKIAKLLSKNYLGAQNPSVQHVLNLKHLASRQGKDTQYDEEVGNAIRDLSSLDATTDEGIDAARNIIKALPSGAAQKLGPWLETHNRNIASQSLRKQTLEQQKELKRTEEQRELSDLKRKARSVALNPEGYNTIDDLSEAYADKLGEIMRNDERRKNFVALPPDMKKEYSDARIGLTTDISDEEKIAAVSKKSDNEMTPELWDKGHKLVRNQRLDRARKVEELINMELGGSPTIKTPQSTEGAAKKEVIPPPPPKPETRKTLAQQIREELESKKAREESIKNAPTNEAWTKGKNVVSEALAAANLDDEFLIPAYRSIVAGERIPTGEMQYANAGGMGVSAPFDPGIDPRDYILEKVGIKPNDEAFKLPDGKKVTYAEALKALAEDKLSAAKEGIRTAAGKHVSIPEGMIVTPIGNAFRPAQ